MKFSFLPSIALVVILSALLRANEEPQERLHRLESETQQLRAEIQAFGQSVQRLPPVDEQSASGVALTAASDPAPASPPTPAAGASTEFTMQQLQGEMAKFCWTKGPFKFSPYGRLWTSMSYDTQRTQIGDYVLWVDSPSVRSGAEFQVDARSTRLGCDIAGPDLDCFCGVKTGGKVEIDFQGTFLRGDEGTVLLRHAYWEMKNEDYRVLAGQTWDVISPLYTPTFDYTAGSAAGNLAYRRAQFRLERYLHSSDEFLISLQTAAAVDIIVPFPTVTRVVNHHGSWPDWQNRVAFTFGDRKAKDAQPIEIGVSGHVGEQNLDFLPLVGPVITNLARPTWSINVDAKVPITPTFGVQGEVFTGTNLSNYFGGILQGIDPVTLQPIRDSGGWVALWYNPLPTHHWNVGYSLDDPLDQDMTVGRLYNQYIFTNYTYDITKALNVGLEVASWKTLYVGLEPGNAVRFETVVRYNF